MQSLRNQQQHSETDGIHQHTVETVTKLLRNQNYVAIYLGNGPKIPLFCEANGKKKTSLSILIHVVHRKAVKFGDARFSPVR